MKTGGRAAVFAGVIALVAALASCGDDSTTETEIETEIETVAEADVEAEADQLFPDVVDATASEGTDGVWRFDVTLSSPYDTPARYADAWRVVGDDGVVYGVRDLTHDHQNEQPFTRSLSGVEIPAAVAIVTVEGRDQVSGWGGQTLQVELR